MATASQCSWLPNYKENKKNRTFLAKKKKNINIVFLFIIFFYE